MGNEFDLSSSFINQKQSKHLHLHQQINLCFPKSVSFPLTIQTLPSQYKDNSNIIPFIMTNDNESGVDVDKVKNEINEINNLLILNGLNDKLWFTKAKCYMLLSQYKEANAYVDIAIELNAQSIEAYYLKMKCLFKLNKINELCDVFDELINNNKHKEEMLLLNKALFLNEIGYHNKAITIYDTLLDKHNTHKESIYYYKGNTLIAINDYENAIKCFDHCLQYDSFNIDYLLRKAVLYQQLDQPNKTKELIYHIESLLNETSNNNNTNIINKSKYDINRIQEYIKVLKLIT